MSKKVACKKCKFIFDKAGECPKCHSGQSIPNWKGRLYIVHPDKSAIAKKIGNDQEGEFAIKVN